MHRTGQVFVSLLATSVALGIGGAVAADGLSVTVDTVSTRTPVVAFGDVCQGDTATETVSLDVTRSGTTWSGIVFGGRQTLRVTESAGPGLSVGDVDGIVLDSSWGTSIGAVASTDADISFDSSSYLGGYSGLVSFRVQGRTPNRRSLTFSRAVFVTANVVACEGGGNNGDAPPVLHLPADMTVEATSADGAVVSFDASASDDVDGPIEASCNPASGAMLPLGETSVACKATDSAGNTTNGRFQVDVVDTTPPVLHLPGDMTVDADGLDGTVVNYAALASDLVDGSRPVECSTPSGSTFAPGTTTVECSASDFSGNVAVGTFSVMVAFDLRGFYEPVSSTETNVVRAGSTVPLKFSVLSSDGSNIADSSVVTGFSVMEVTPTGDVEDTDRRARLNVGQNQYTLVWQTPRSAGTYRVELQLADGQTMTALFETR